MSDKAPNIFNSRSFTKQEGEIIARIYNDRFINGERVFETKVVKAKIINKGYVKHEFSQEIIDD